MGVLDELKMEWMYLVYCNESYALGVLPCVHKDWVYEMHNDGANVFGKRNAPACNSTLACTGF